MIVFYHLNQMWVHIGLGIFALLFLTALLVVMLFPFGIVTINAIKTPQEYASDGPLSLPGGIYTQGLRDFWERVDFTNKLVNSTVISVTVAVAAR